MALSCLVGSCLPTTILKEISQNCFAVQHAFWKEVSKTVWTIVIIASSHVALQLQRLRINPVRLPVVHRCGLPQSRHGFAWLLCAPRSNVAKFQECVAATSCNICGRRLSWMRRTALRVKTQTRALQKASLSTRDVASVKLAGMLWL